MVGLTIRLDRSPTLNALRESPSRRADSLSPEETHPKNTSEGAG